MARDVASAEKLRGLVRSFVQGFGLLDEQRTPCGLPVAPREAHALARILAAELESRPLRQAELASALKVDKSNVTRVVQRLVNGGYVAQDQGEDARQRLLRLSAKGRRLAERIEAASLTRFETVLVGMPKSEIERVLHALDVLNQAIERVSAEVESARS